MESSERNRLPYFLVMIELVSWCSRIWFTSIRSVTIDRHTVDSRSCSGVYSCTLMFKRDRANSPRSNSFSAYSVEVELEMRLKSKKSWVMKGISELVAISNSDNSLNLSKYLLSKSVKHRSQYSDNEFKIIV